MKKLQIAALVSMMFGLLWIPLYTFQVTGVRAEEGETVTGNVYGDDAGEADDWPDDVPMFTLMGGGDDYITFLFEKFNASDKYDPIANPNGPLILHNSASITSEVARLTPAVGGSKGSLFNREYVVLPADRSFSTYFVFKIHGGGGYPPGWGDGFVFTVQKKTNQPSGEGGSLGYADLAPSIAVKFDTWKNDEHGDPSDNNIAILKDGKISPALKSHDVSKTTNDFKSGEHHVWIDYNGSNATLEIRLNKNSERPELAELSYPLPDTLANILGTELVYVGFTAATGGAFQNHDILKWYFTNEYNPIDVLTRSYKKAPTGYAITKTETVQHDGSLDLTIKAIGVDNTEGLTIELSADNNAVLSPSTLTLDANGEATVNIRSPNSRHLQTTLAILGVAGIRSTHDLTIPGKTPRPDEQDITANATNNTATVRNVEGGAVVRVYSVSGGVEIGTAANTSGEAADLVIQLSQAINPGDQVRVTVHAAGELASDPATVTALEESAKPDAGKIQADGTADRVTVQDVPANTTVVIRDGSGKLLGQKKNGGAAADVVLDELGLDFGMSIVVTLIGDGKLESEPVTVPVMFSQTDAPKETDIDANATTKVVKVTNVPAGATVKVYHANGNPLASGTNNGGAGAAVSLTITSGLEQNQEIHVTLTEPRKTESIKTKATAYYEKSDAPKAADIDPNATTSVVTVKNVPAGATVKVYHADGSPLASGTNNGGAGGEVNLTVNPRLANGQALDVTLTETYKTESDKTRVAAYYEQSAALDAADIDPNASASVVTVKNVPAGATVKVYHADGSPLASGTNNGGAGGEVSLTIDPRLANGQALDVTLTETYKTESDKTRVAAYYEKSEAPKTTDIDANATANAVKVTNVPAGATVKVYHTDGSPLASGTNNGGAGGEVSLTIDPRLANGQALDVTLTETYKTESDKTRVTAYYEQSAALDTADIDPNATTSVVTVKNVPAGATVKVYHADGSPLASGTNNGGAGGEVNLTVNPRLANGQALDVTLTETYKTESDKTRVAAYYEQSAALDAADIDPNASASVVTVKNVPAGATVKVYHADGSPLASGTNNGGAGGEVNLTVNPRIANGQALDVTLTETYKTESDKTRVAAYYEQSAAPKAADIDPNATASVVTVKNVPAGAAVTVYDKNGTPLASNVNNGGAPANVSLTFDPRLANGQELDVTLTETYKTESDKTRVAAYYEQSAALDAARITVNATDLEVTVTGVEPEATITVYGADGSTVLGSHKNNGAANADLVMALAGTLQASDTVLVTVTEAYRAESAATAAVALAETARLPEERIRADATDSRITITDAPPGAVIVVYDEQGNPIATVKNDSDVAADLTVDIVPELTPGQEIRVTIREPGKLESDPVAIEAQETTPAPDNALDIDIDVEAGTVTVIGVPPHTTVIVYDGNGKEIGREANNGGAPADIVIADLELDESVQISFRERDKHESDKLVIVIKDQAQDAIDEAIAELEIDYQKEDTWESVTLPVYVASVGKHNTAVSWTSSKPDVVEITKPQGGRIEALVHRQQQDVSVILTAKVSKNGVGKTRTFLVIVKAADLTKTVEEGYRKVDVIGGANADVQKDVDVHRVVLTNGTQEAKIDKAVFDHATADRFANDPKSRNSTARIYVNEVPGDEADEFAVEVAGTALERLHGNGNAIEVRTDYGNILIRHETMEDMVDNSLDLYFRLVPVKDAARQQAINSGILNEPAVQNEAAGGKVVDIPGRSMLVETNYSGYPTTLTLYFAKNGIEVPESDTDAFLASLRVFVEHSDGTTDLLTPTPVYENGRPVGVSIVIDKFSTFSIIRLLEPIAYIPVRNTPGEPSAGPEPGEQSAGPGPTAPGAAGPDGRTIEIVLDGENYRVDPEGFKVSVGGRMIGIAEVETAGRVVTIRLSEPLPAGYRIKVDYTPASAGGGNATEPRLKPFIGLELAIPGFHAPYIFGFADGTFRPENAITRAEIAAILARNLDLPPGGAYAGLFGDVPSAHWAWSDIERLKRSGLMIGDASGNFRPQAPITRAEMAMIAAKWLGADLSAAGSPAFADVDGGHWAAAAIDAASRAGILVGFEDGTFRPDERLTRAQAVAVMNRLLGRRPHSGIDAPTWPDVRPNHWAFAEIEEASRPHRFLYDDDGRETPVEDDM